MSSTSSSRSILLLGALLLLAGCGAGGMETGHSDYPRWGGPDCVDEWGFPVPCDDPRAIPFKAGAASASIGWTDSANGALVADADGTFVTFDAEAPHGMRVGAHPIPGLRAAADGRLHWFDQPVGTIALVPAGEGAWVAALIADDGTYLDLANDGDGLVLRRTALAAPLEAAFSATTAGAPDGAVDDPRLPAGTIAGDPLVLDGLASTDVLVETF
jgi:hypothetical protein